MASSDEPSKASGGPDRGSLYGGFPEAGAPGLAPQLIRFCDELRREGVKLGSAEILDAVGALGEVSWTDREDFREALAATMAKSQEDRRVFELVFDRFFFRAVEAQAVEKGLKEQRFQGGDRIDLEDLKQMIQEAIRAGRDGDMADLARLAVAALGGQGETSGVIGVDVQRIRRTLDLRQQSSRNETGSDRDEELDRDNLRRFEAYLRRELERGLIHRTESLPPAKPLAEFDRALPGGPLQDLAQVHRVVAQLKRRLATSGHEQRGRKKSRVVDIRRTMRASLETGGVPLRLRVRPSARGGPRSTCSATCRPRSRARACSSSPCCTRSTTRSASSAASPSSSGSTRSPRSSSASGPFRRSPRRSPARPGVADVSGYTDYGRVWTEFLAEVSDDLDPRSTVIVLGDARTNGREPHAPIFGRVADKAGRTFWLNPEPKLYWNYGDSVMAAYEPYCDAVFECWTTKQLEQFVNVIAGSPEVV